MFCPTCKDEFRPGFTRCASCNVDLVEDLASVEEPREGPTAPGPPMPVRLSEYCGYLTLEEARDARDRLREERIAYEIALRDAPGAAGEHAAEEEYWLRVDATKLQRVAQLLGSVPAVEPEAQDDGFACGDCGQQVGAEESFCPKCGARFDE